MLTGRRRDATAKNRDVTMPEVTPQVTVVAMGVLVAIGGL